jgi:uroporphyrinogen decarboxylase
MTSRERFIAALSGAPSDRIPICDTGFWGETIERWRREGLPRDADLCDYFGLDRIEGLWPNTGFRLPSEVIEETEDCVIFRDSMGATVRRWRDEHATPQHLDWALKTRADWERMKEHLHFDLDRIPSDIAERCRQAHERGALFYINPVEPGWFFLHDAMGYEGCLKAMLDDPAWVDEMYRTHFELALGLMRHIYDEMGVRYDAVWFFSDLCYRNGMFFSPRVYRDLLMPYHKEFARFCHERGVYLMLHCDGDVRELIPLLIEAGFDAIQPLEARAGNDVRKLAKEHDGRITFFGNISAEIVTEGGARLEHEIRTKVAAAKAHRRYIYHIDHSVPPTVSLANYQRALALAREVADYG